jgi:hypothetical protein
MFLMLPQSMVTSLYIILFQGAGLVNRFQEENSKDQTPVLMMKQF